MILKEIFGGISINKAGQSNLSCFVITEYKQRPELNARVFFYYQKEGGVGMEELFLRIGAIAGAATAIGTCIWKFVIKPFIIVPYREKCEARMEKDREFVKEELAFRKKVLEELGVLKDKLDDNQLDIIHLQRYKLKTEHDRLMRQGWCTEAEREGIIDLYDRYATDKGRNSLAKSFKDDVLGLPREPKH